LLYYKKPISLPRLLRVIPFRSLQSLRLFTFIRFAHSLHPARSFAPCTPFPLQLRSFRKTAFKNILLKIAPHAANAGAILFGCHLFRLRLHPLHSFPHVPWLSNLQKISKFSAQQ
jgi:hypothetical protein